MLNSGLLIKGKILKNQSWISGLAPVLLGALIAYLGTITSELWLIPAKQEKIHRNEIAELKFSKLYAPLVLATGKGQFSMTGDMVFYKVHEIMEEYGHLADEELVTKYIEFLGLSKSASYDDLKSGSPIQMPLPDDVVIEIIKQRKAPLVWTPSRLEKALKVEQEFNAILLEKYSKAREAFLERSGLIQ